MALSDESYDRPVHGPEGKIALLRRLLRLRQADLAAEIGASRETISHWENVLPDGRPRSRVSRRKAAALAELVRNQLGESVEAAVFLDPEESAIDVVLDELRVVRQQLDALRAHMLGGKADWVSAGPIFPTWNGSDEELLNATQASRLLTIEPRTLMKWAREGRVPCIRLGSRAIRWTRPLLREIRDAATRRDVL